MAQLPSARDRLSLDLTLVTNAEDPKAVVSGLKLELVSDLVLLVR
jgi:hypothetical protein